MLTQCISDCWCWRYCRQCYLEIIRLFWKKLQLIGLTLQLNWYELQLMGWLFVAGGYFCCTMCICRTCCRTIMTIMIVLIFKWSHILYTQCLWFYIWFWKLFSSFSHFMLFWWPLPLIGAILILSLFLQNIEMLTTLKMSCMFMGSWHRRIVLLTQ